MNKNIIKKLLNSLFIIALTFFAAAFPFAVKNTSASTNKISSYTDDFTGSAFSEKWISRGVELNCDYSALSIVDFNIWGPCINLVNYPVKANSTITFDVINIGGGGSWLGLAFGLESPSSRVYYAEGLIVMSSVTKDDCGVALETKKGAELSASTMDEHERTPESVFPVTNVKKTVKIVAEENGNVTVYAGDCGGTLKKAVYFTGVFKEGYVGFSGFGGASFDITSFRLETDGALVYAADFSSDKMGYSSTGMAGCDWFVSYSYGEENAYISPSNSALFGKGQSLLFNNKIVSEKDRENQGEISVKIKLKDLKNGGYFGLGCGLESDFVKIDEANYLGFYKYSDKIRLAHISYGKLKAVTTPISVEEGENAGYIDFSVLFKSGKKIVATVNGESFAFDDFDFDGYYAFGGAGDEDFCAVIDDFSFSDYVYLSSSDADTSINFNGIKTVFDEQLQESYSTEYINKYLYYIGTQVSQSKYNDNYDGNLKFIGTTETSVFIPKKQYGESVIRFDIKISDNTPTDKKWERIGVAVGLPSPYFKPTSAPFFCFQRNCSLNGENEVLSDYTITYANGMTDCTTEGVVSQTKNCEYNLWSDTSTVYNVMLIVENNEVRVYYKTDAEPEENMTILRRKFKNVSAYGYVGFFGYNGASFSLDNVSVTNVNPYKQTEKDFNGVTIAEKTLKTDVNSQNSLVFADVCGDGSAITLSFGGKTLTVAENALTAGEGIFFTEEKSAIGLLNGSYTIRAEVFGDNFTVGVRNGGSESQLYTPLVCGKITGKQNGEISLSLNGGAEFIRADAYSLDTKIELKTENYDENYENSLNPIKIKPEKPINSGSPNAVTIAIVSVACGVAVIAAGIVIIMAVKRKKFRHGGAE